MAGYIGATPVPQATQHRKSFTATAGQTSFATGGYTPGFIDVYLNGVKLAAADFTATNGSDVVLASGAAVGDILETISFTAFEIASQTFSGTTTVDDLTVGGNVTFGDNNKAIFGAGSDLEVFHDGSASNIIDNGTGNLFICGSGAIHLMNPAQTEYYASFNDNGAVDLRYDNSIKLATTSTGIDVTGTVTASGAVDAVGFQDTQSTTGFGYLNFGDTDDANIGQIGYDHSSNYMRFQVNNAERMRIDSSGNVGIGTTSPAANHKLNIDQAGYVQALLSTSGTARLSLYGDAAVSAVDAKANPLALYAGSSERVRIDSSGNLLVGKTSNDFSTNGVILRGTGEILVTRSANVATFRRNSTDGEIVNLRKDSTTVGSIGNAGSNSYFSTGDTGLLFAANIDAVIPTNQGATRDNAIDLGNSGNRFDDIYATNSTIQTSDQNEKQQIASLTDTEMTAAKAISALYKTFKWNDSVADKGDAARTHTGVIAQEVEQAMTDAGLDAGDYAFFISATWWETQTEVPAVEAVEAVYEDVVIPAILDDDGNEVEAERTEQRLVSEAVEAKDAYTRTDTYDTDEEAPDGATERNRKGIRYPELLAFVGAATEQRLASIETRLTALEAE